MEVHAHTHTPRKKWTHYLWEFLMLFLAVFCGFLAENFREHQVEKQRGKKYILAFYEDLVKDTAGFTNVINSYEEKTEVFKIRNECYHKIINSQASGDCLAGLFRHSERFIDLVYTDGTLQQLKNAGGLRLLKKDEVDSILSYDNLIRSFTKSEATGFQDRQNKLRDVIYSISNYAIVADSNFHGPAVFDEKDKKIINQYFVMLNAYANAINRMKESLKEIKAKAISLIEYFKKMYHLQ